MYKPFFLFSLLFSLCLYAQDNQNLADDNLHYTKKIFRSNQNLLVKKDLEGHCIVSSDDKFNTLKDYEKFNSLDSCLDSGGIQATIQKK